MKVLNLSEKWTVQGFFRWRDSRGLAVPAPDWGEIEGTDDIPDIKPTPVVSEVDPFWRGDLVAPTIEDNRWVEWVGPRVLMSRREAVARARERAMKWALAELQAVALELDDSDDDDEVPDEISDWFYGSA